MALEIVKSDRPKILTNHQKTSISNLILATEKVLTLEEVQNSYRDHINPTLLKIHKFSSCAQIEHEALEEWVWDSVNHSHLDCISGFGVFSLGHRHPEIVAQVCSQAQKMPLASKGLLNEPLARLAKILIRLAPVNLNRLLMLNSGSEAIEAAIKLALYSTKRSQIISMKGAYHGKTLVSQYVSDRLENIFGPDNIPFDLKRVEFGNAKALLEEISEKTAAVIVEPVQGEGGINIPPSGWLREVQELCRFHGTVFIVDEIQTGFGRTGKMFACEWDQAEPDILCLGKALGGGVIPAAALLIQERLFKPFIADPLFHSSTFGGNPLACIAALTTIRILLRDQIPQRSEILGQKLLSKLRTVTQNFSQWVQEVRGKGLMIGVEMKNPSNVGAVINSLRKRNILVAPTLNKKQVLRLEPPLILGEDSMGLLITGFKESLQELNEMELKNK